MTTQEARDLLDELLFELELERTRLFLEAEALDVARVSGCAAAVALVGPALGFALCDLDVGQLRTRADGLRTIAAAIEAHVERFPSAADVTVNRLAIVTEQTALILAAVGDASGISDLLTDIRIFVEETARDARRLADKIRKPSFQIGFGVVTGVALALVGVVALKR